MTMADQNGTQIFRQLLCMAACSRAANSYQCMGITLGGATRVQLAFLFRPAGFPASATAASYFQAAKGVGCFVSTCGVADLFCADFVQN